MNVRVGSDDCERQVISDVREYGWHCLNVLEEKEGTGFSFSIGFFETWQHPELIIVGLPFELAHSVLELVAAGLGEGRRLDLALPTADLVEGPPWCFVEVPKGRYYDYVGTARWYYGGSGFPLYQVVWPSREGYFPWNERADAEFRTVQPVLGDMGRGS